MPPLPNGKFGDDVETHGSSFLQEYNLLILRIILPSIGVGLLVLVAVIIVVIKCRLCCRHRREVDHHAPSTATGEKSAQLENGRGYHGETARTRHTSSNSTDGLLCSVSAGLEALHEVDEEAEEEEEKKGKKAPIYTNNV